MKGEALWKQPRGDSKAACSSCHAEGAMRGVAARYPRYDESLGRVVNVEARINACVTTNQRGASLPWESEELLALTAYVARQSKGLPISVSIDGKAKPVFEGG